MRLTNKGLRPKELLTLDGVLTIHRTILVPADKESAETLLNSEGRTCIYPLDEILGIENIPFKATYRAVAKVAKEGIRCRSYKEAAAQLNERHHHGISPGQVKRITDYVAALIYADDCRRAEEAKTAFRSTIDRRKCKRDVLYIEFDGSFYLENVPDGPGCEWKECKIAIAFKKSNMHMGGNGISSIEERDYVGFIGGYEEFKAHLLALAIRNGAYTVKEMVAITDGSKWILPVIKELFPWAVAILDKFHAKENAGKFAMAVKRGKKQKEAFAKQLCDLIDKGNVQELLKVLEPYKDFKRPGVVNFYQYVYRLQDCMHYDEYEKLGYLTGSGHIESTHRYVMQNRMKGPGQHWNRETGQGILSAKCRYESDHWDDEVISLIRQDYERCRQERSKQL